MQQLPLEIALDEDLSFDNFLIGKNHILLDYLRSTGSNTDAFIYLWGGQGSGKSHLLQSYANQYEPVAYLPLKEPSLKPEMLEGLEQLPCVCLDDIDVVSRSSAWQMALFHLYNGIKEQGGRLLITSCQAPKSLNLSLKDLESRLTAMVQFKIQSLTDQDKAVLLQHKASAKGLSLPSEVAKFMLNRSSRDLHCLMSAMDTLDQASLIKQRKLTLPFIKDVLGL